MLANTSIELPYCGMPPTPVDLPMAWNSDWRLWLALAALASAVTLTQRRGVFAAAWLALVVAYVSPLCAFTVALFAARSVHHVWLVVVAAPLLAMAFPQLGRRIDSHWALLVLVLVLALWHVPQAYRLVWISHSFYWSLQLLLLVSAVIFWARILQSLHRVHSQPTSEVVTALAQIAVLSGVMGLIGAVLTFAPHVLYPEHGLAMLPYGLEPLQDQQLAGLLMWVPGGLPLAALAAYVLQRAWKGARERAEVAVA